MSEARTQTPQPEKPVPYLGPEILDLLFRLGPLTTAQIGALLPWALGDAERDAVGLRNVQKVLRSLRAGGKLSTTNRKARLFAETSGTRHKPVHNLTDPGLAFVAARQGLYLSKAASLYRQVFQEALVDHALLRNEYYARLAEDLARERPAGGPLSDLGFETMCAEGGYTPIPLSPSPVTGRRRYLNPDGLLTFVREGDPSYRRSVWVESDTGSEDMPWQVAGKADQYAEHWCRLLVEEETALERLPSLLFVSPRRARARWVRETIRERGLQDGSTFGAAVDLFAERGASLPSLVIVTCYEWLERHGGPLGPAYWSLADRSLTELLP
jgi:hypothetical protein